MRRHLLAAGAALLLCPPALLRHPAAAQDTAPMPGLAPTGDKISEQRIPFYHRGTPVIALSGPLTEEGVREAKRVGFSAILDLQADPARAANERRNAEFARIRYHHLPLRAPAPSGEEVQRFAAVLADPANLPLLVHGASPDQSGAMWAAYRASLGVPPAIAVLDGQTAGLHGSRDAVRAALGLPAETR